ncbi:MAG: IS21 family transposase [Rikenellaceae bacterium]
MSNKLVKMKRLRTMLQLLEQGHSQRKICEQLGMGRNICSRYLTRATASEKSIRELLSLSDESLSQILYPPPRNPPRLDPRLEYLQSRLDGYKKELQQPSSKLHAKVTIQLLWEEYCSECTSQSLHHYGYTQFKEHLLRHLDTTEYAFHNSWEPGKQMQVDFAGDYLYLYDARTHEKISCPVLVCTLPASSLVFAVAMLNARQANFYDGLNRALCYFGGVPQHVHSDNMTQWVKRADRYEPTFSDAAVQWGTHNGTYLSAARVAKPKDKGNVESHVNIIYKRIYARLRNEIFYTIESLNKRILELVDDLNNRQMQGKGESRRERFERDERMHLSPLASEEFVFKSRKSVTINSTYHIQIPEDRHFYSVPYQHIGKQAIVVYTNTEVEVYVDLERIAIHKRDTTNGGYSTLDEHMPESHRAYKRSKEHNAEYYLRTSAEIGKYARRIIENILSSNSFVQQGYRSCEGILNLANKYESERVEAACKRASVMEFCSYKHIKNILEKGLDQVTEPESTLVIPLPQHDNIRGAEAYS